MHVRAEAGRESVDHHLDDAAEGVAVLVRLVDALDHQLRGVGVQAAHRVVVEARHVIGSGHGAGRGTDAAELDDVGDHPGVGGLLEEQRRHPAQSDARGRLARGGALEDGSGLVEVVLLHPDEVGVAGPGTGERRVAGQRVELRRGRPGRTPSPAPTWATRCCR